MKDDTPARLLEDPAKGPREQALKLIEDAGAAGDAAKIDNIASRLLLNLAIYEYGREDGIAVVAELRAIARAAYP